MSVDGAVVGVPVQFYCEHSTSKSRVLALVKQPGYAPSLHAVLTCTDRVVAERAADILHQAVESGRGPTIVAEAERVVALLPDAPAASFRQALDRVIALSWPIPDVRSVTWEEVRAGYGFVHSDDLPDTPGLRDGALRTPYPTTPSQLSGVLVQLEQTLQLHIHDPARLLAAARADGWEPDGDEGDPDDLLGAVMWLADDTPDLPGVDTAGHSSEGSYLSGSVGDGLGGTGDTDSGPDFVPLFPVVAGGEDAEWQLTPRTADALYTALCLLADEAYDDVEQHGDKPIPGRGADWAMLDRLPRLSWGQDAQWRRQVARAAEDLSQDLEAGRWPIPRCNAEELCLHLAIKDAEGLAADQEMVDLALPEHADDYDWGMCSTLLFQDHDILLLDQGWADGIEDPDGEVNRAAGIGDLRPANWFRPFDNVEPRDPQRGFRR